MAACNTPQKEAETSPAVPASTDTLPAVVSGADTTPIPIGDNSENSLDWNGTYKGIVPCADCEGIETTLVLNLDRTFSLQTKYLGKTNSVGLDIKGNFTWNRAGNTITLGGIKEAPAQYLVGENHLRQLDMSGQKITGALEEKYLLKKIQ
jgi:copper homeostasis protein (lipoprotein)